MEGIEPLSRDPQIWLVPTLCFQ